MTIEELFGTLQQAVVGSWRKHLRTAKYGKHEALDEFYKEMPEKVDDLIEAWMGANGKKIGGFENLLKSANYNTLSYLKELKKICKQGYDLLDDNEELESLLDDIVNLINSTLYKVKELNESMIDLKDFINESLIMEDDVTDDAVLKKDYIWVNAKELDKLKKNELISNFDKEDLLKNYLKNGNIVIPKGTILEYLGDDPHYVFYNINDDNIEICIDIDMIKDLKSHCK